MVYTISRTENHSARVSSGLKEPVFKCRYVVVWFGFWIYFLTTSAELQLSVSIVAMVNNSGILSEKSDSCPSLLMNASDGNDFTKTNEKLAGEFTWSPKLQGYILGSIYFGNLIFSIPAGILCQTFGSKRLLMLSTSLFAMSTLLIPVFTRLNVCCLIALEVLRGFSQAIVRPAVSNLAANWFPRLERGLLYPIILTGFSAGSISGSVGAGYLCEYFGWPVAFYYTGAFVIILSLSIAIFLHESPRVHPRISQAELEYIINNQEKALSRKQTPPWRQILTSVPFYAAIIAQFGRYWSLFYFLTVHATYLGTILHYSIEQNGIISAAPFLSMFVFSHIASWLSSIMQKKYCASVNFVRKFWNSLFCIGYTACILGIYFAGCNSCPSIIFGIISMGFCGLSVCGCPIVPNDMSPNFSGTLMAVTAFIDSISGLVIPLLVGYLTDGQQTIERWHQFMHISVGVVMSSGILFLLFGSAEVQPWNFPAEEKTEENENTVTRC